jgi:signal transduction histidine kinase
MATTRTQRSNSRSAPPGTDGDVHTRLLVAMDLHDLIIQRLFGAGLSLEIARREMRPGVSRERVEDALQDVDVTIGELRQAIAALQGGEFRPVSLADQIRNVAASASHALGFAPSLFLETLDEFVLPAGVARDVTAVVSEALSNTARHAGASVVTVHVAATGGEVRVRVVDNGRGMGEARRRSGLSNLSVRAARQGGTFALSTDDGIGTSLTWCVPLADTAMHGGNA